MIDTHRHGEDHRLRLGRAWPASPRARRRPSAPASSARCSTRRRNISSAKPARQRSDLFSLGVIAYQMLSGRLPYGAEVAQARTRAAQRELRYALGARRRARDPGLDRRGAAQGGASRSARALRGARRSSSTTCGIPNAELPALDAAPLIERNPVAFWKGLSFVLAMRGAGASGSALRLSASSAESRSSGGAQMVDGGVKDETTDDPLLGQTLLPLAARGGDRPRQTLNRKWKTSPSFTAYSLPSNRSLPASRAPASPFSET